MLIIILSTQRIYNHSGGVSNNYYIIVFHHTCYRNKLENHTHAHTYIHQKGKEKQI